MAADRRYGSGRGLDTSPPLDAECQAPNGRRPDRRDGKYLAAPVTIMASCVPCLFRKPGPGTGAIWSAEIRQSRLRVVSLQVRAVVAGNDLCRARAKQAVCQTVRLPHVDDLGYPV
jgi:hypothetical protein